MESLDNLIDELTNQIDVSSKRIVQPGFACFSRLETTKPDRKTRGERRNQAKQKRESTAGKAWFDMPTKELELEDKLTLDALRLRETLNPGKFYKRKATEKMSRQFQVGTIIEHPMDYYSSRATKKEKKQTLVDELIADSEFKKNVKRRYNRIRATNAIRQKEKALAERRKLLQNKRKKKSKTD